MKPEKHQLSDANAKANAIAIAIAIANADVMLIFPPNLMLVRMLLTIPFHRPTLRPTTSMSTLKRNHSTATAYCLLPTAYHPPPTTHYPLPITYCLLLLRILRLLHTTTTSSTAKKNHVNVSPKESAPSIQISPFSYFSCCVAMHLRYPS